MTLKIYGNQLSPDAPANLQVDIQRLEKLYGLSDINGDREVAALLVATTVVDKKAASHPSKGVAVPPKDRSAA